VRWRRIAVLLLVAASIGACSTVAGEPPADPQPCGEVYRTQTCLAMTDEAASRSHRTRDDVSTIDIVQLPTRDQAGALITRSGGGFFARLTFTDGTTRDEAMCGGIPSGPACMDSPRLEARSSIQEGGGYHDVPCPDGSPPDTCGTPLPTLQPAAVAGARSLSVARFEIPIDHIGTYEVPLGEVSFPNGIATAASFEFADPWPLDVSLGEGVAQIDLRSLEPDGKPFQNYFDHGWRPGVERAEAILAFDVLWFKTGAVLGIRNVVVR
jgi:hypothetical protein